MSSPSLYAIDECGFNLSEIPYYAYSKRGSRAVVSRLGKRGENHTLILCIKNAKIGGIVHWKLIKGGMRSEDFHDFLKEIDFSTDKENNLLIDNAKVHHASQSCIKKDRLPIKELAKLKNMGLIYNFTLKKVII